METKKLMDWTSKQGRILTGDGKATEYYTAERGFPFEPEELPHHHLIKGTTNDVFAKWSKEQNVNNPVCGAFFRPLFVGGFEHSTSSDEVTFNVQTNTLFIDIRIPHLGLKLLKDHNSFEAMSNDELSLYSRRHAFAGYTKLAEENGRPCCTRHHCMDWNFAGNPRPRPNKWYVEMASNKNTWKEWSFARDNYQQHYYWERWERLENDGGGNGFVLAMRKKRKNNKERDGIIVAVGDHFNYIYGRDMYGKDVEAKADGSVSVIDDALNEDDRVKAISFLSLSAGHGLISNGWKIDCNLQHWKNGTSLFSGDKDEVTVKGYDISSCEVVIGEERWEVYECNEGVKELEKILKWRVREGDGKGDKDAAELKQILLGKKTGVKRKLDE